MARVHFDLNVRGHVSNDVARQFDTAARRFSEGCAEAGLEVRGNGLSVELDAEATVEPQPESTEPEPA